MFGCSDVKDLPIGVIDSGVGGLTVLKQLREKMPAENFVYIGDTARCPYGDYRSDEEIRRFTGQMLDALVAHGVKAIVVACNTISMFGAENLARGLRVPLVTMSKGVQLLLSVSRSRRIGVFATPFTISKNLHFEAIKAAAPDARVTTVGCNEFVPMIETEKFGSLRLQGFVARYCRCIRDEGCDALLLACTHYPFIRADIESELGPGVTVIDPAEQTALDTVAVLGPLLRREGRGRLQICVTGETAKVRRLAARLLDSEGCEFIQIRLADV